MSTLKQKMLDKAGQIIAGIVYDIHIDTGSHTDGFDMSDWLHLEDKLHELKPYVEFRDALRDDQRLNHSVRELIIDQILDEEERHSVDKTRQNSG